MTKRVLYVGIDPALLDRSALPPGITPEVLMVGIRDIVTKLGEHGYEAHWCPIDLGETAAVTVERALAERSFDCVVIGAGIRALPPHLLLFEQIVNVVHRGAAQAAICFNTTPADTVDAVKRWT